MVLHYGPARIIVYADGYTVAVNRACDSSERIHPESMTLRPWEVDCAACRCAPAFLAILADYERTGLSPMPEVEHVDRMAHAVFRLRGVYDVAENNRRRAALYLDPVFPVLSTRAELLAREDVIHAGYDRNRAERARVDDEAKRQGLDPAGVARVVSLDMATGETSTRYFWTEPRSASQSPKSGAAIGRSGDRSGEASDDDAESDGSSSC